MPDLQVLSKNFDDWFYEEFENPEETFFGKNSKKHGSTDGTLVSTTHTPREERSTEPQTIVNLS